MSTLGYEVEWFDPISGNLTRLFLKYYMEDKTIELVFHAYFNFYYYAIYEQ